MVRLDRPRRVALRLPERRRPRCVRIDFCHSLLEHGQPRFVRSRVRHGLRRAMRRAERFTTLRARFGRSRVGRVLRRSLTGRCLPGSTHATDPLTSLSPPPREPLALSHAWTLREGRQDRFVRAFVKRRALHDRGCLPSAGTFAQLPRLPRPSRGALAERRPFERPAPAFPGLVTLPPRSGCRPLFTRRAPLARTRFGPGSRPRAPMPSGASFFEPRCRLPISATLTTRGHAPRAFDPRPPGGQIPTLPAAPSFEGGSAFAAPTGCPDQRAASHATL